MKRKLIGPFSQLLPLSHLPLKGSLKDEDIKIITDGGIIVNEARIERVGKFKDLNDGTIPVERVHQPTVAIPGLIDAHTHICYAGSRAQDYALRNSGKTYLEIAKSGGGIWDTVTKTRNASIEHLEDLIIARGKKMLLQGITTLEVKSGYGLSVPEELKMLKAIKAVAPKLKQNLVTTCLAAHMLPKDYKGNGYEYLDEIATHLLPTLQVENLAQRVDAFVEESAFSPEEITPYLKKAKALGFDITVHADQFTTGGSKVGVALGAISVDHLEASTQKEIEHIAKSNTVAVALPGASLGLGCKFTPARKLLDAGAVLAIASDYNPGSAPMGNLMVQASILGTFEKLSNAEIFAALTYRAAAALNLKFYGSLAVGYYADLALYPTDDYREITYQQGQMLPHGIIKHGEKIAF